MPFKDPASLHDWQGGPPIIPVMLSGKSQDGTLRMSASIRFTSGKFARNVGQIFASNSFAVTVLKPALWKPKSNPPAPEKRLIKSIMVLFYFQIQFIEIIVVGIPTIWMSNFRLGATTFSALCIRNENCHPPSI